MKIKQRNIISFYEDPIEIDRKFETICLDTIAGFGDEWSLNYAFTKTVTYKDDPFRIKELQVHLIKVGEENPVGYMSFNVFTRRNNRYIYNDDFVFTCDAYSSGLYDFAYSMCENQNILDINDYFQEGGFAELSRIEIRTPFNGNGLGTKSAELFFAQLKNQFKINYIFFKPFPLQHEGSRHKSNLECTKEEMKNYEKCFNADKSKLLNVYKNKFKAKRLNQNNDYYVVII